MNNGRPPVFGKEFSARAPAAKTTAGKTRICPHCKSTILDSASICPACQHHLRFGPAADQQTLPRASPLKVEGVVRHPGGEPWEYSIVISVRNERGEEITRQVVGVGALQPMEQRTFHLSVEMFVPAGAKSFK